MCAKSDGVVRVMFATVALGMEIGLKDVNTIIHYMEHLKALRITFKKVEGVAYLVTMHDHLCTGSFLIALSERS